MRIFFGFATAGLLGTILFAGTVQADTIIFNDLGAGDTYNCCTGDGAWGTGIAVGPLETAGTFTPSTTASFGELLIALSVFGSGNSDAVVSMVADGGGAPTGAVLDSWDVSGLPGFGSTNSTLQGLFPHTSITLAAGTPYWIMIAPEFSNTDVIWNASLTPGYITETNSGSGWVSAGATEAFEVLSPIPEPGSLSLLGIGIAVTAALRRLRGSKSCTRSPPT